MEAKLIKLPEVPKEISIRADWLEAREALVLEVGQITAIETTESFEAAGDLLRRVTKTSNAMEKFRKDFADPFAEAAKAIKRASDAARDPLERVKERLQRMLNSYAEDQQKKRAEEQRRIELENRKVIERQLAERAKAEAEADELGLEDLPEAAPVVVPAVIPETERPRAEAVRVQETVAWDIADEGAVPAAFKVVDRVKVNGWLAQNKDLVRQTVKDDPEKAAALIPGIVFRIETKVISR